MKFENMLIEDKFDFDFNLPLDKLNLSQYLSNIFKERAEMLYLDLFSNLDQICLIPAPIKMHEGHMVRIRESFSPEWYLQLYHSHEYEFKARSQTTNRMKNYSTSTYKRYRALQSFQRIMSGKDLSAKRSSYDLRNRELIFEDLTSNKNSIFGINNEFKFNFIKIPDYVKLSEMPIEFYL